MNMVLKVAILDKYHSQSDFALEARMGETLVSKIVRERRSPTEEQKESMAKALGLSKEEIFPECREN